MATTAAVSKLSRLSMSALETTGAGSIPLFYTRFEPNCIWEMIDIGDGVAGFANLGRPIELTKRNIKRVNPRSSHKPAKGEIDDLLKSIFNISALVGGAYTYDPTSQTTKIRSFDFDDTQTVWRINGCTASSASFSAPSGGELSLDIDWAGTDFSVGGAYPAGLDITPCLGPRWIFAEGTVTIAGTQIKTRGIRIMVNNHVSNDRYFYGAVSAGPVSLERTCTIELDIPYGLHPTLRSAINVDGGAAASVEFTDGTNVLLFEFPAIRSNSVSPAVNVPAEVFMPFVAQCFDIRTPGSEATGIKVTIT